ncbi:sulfurtransferase [Leptolyngbya valderiana BDU 20041]|nr:rhodanese-like domain-containing protein [Geitlerinema sp. CS-897]OAB61781.1 sulfurtransferase [Leptolyngbya valderiana BDU 20041]PPT09541.1 Rhodanese-related sulfurtransferase [Geitlerinema sp. FC II]
MTTATRAETVTDITPQAFVSLPHSPTLIDVRSQLEYAAGHAPNARNLSLPRVMLGSIPLLRKWMWPEWFRSLPKDEPIAIVCLTAHRSPIAAQHLVKQGFSQVYNLSGGMVEWWKTIK